jgi:hypothetical protein
MDKGVKTKHFFPFPSKAFLNKLQSATWSCNYFASSIINIIFVNAYQVDGNASVIS